MLELYHSVNSVCAQKVRIVFAEKSLQWQEHLMTLAGDQYDPGYLKLNPNGVVPTLIHDGNVIVDYPACAPLSRERGSGKGSPCLGRA